MPLKHMQAISEARSDIGERGRPPYDATYANEPVNYIKLDAAADGRRHEPDHRRDEARRLLRDVGRGADHRRTRSRAPATSGPSPPSVEWTFPLDFVEVVWGDGVKTDRQIISTTDLPAFGKKKFTDPVQRGREEVGALRRLGRRHQRRVRSADAGSAPATTSNRPERDALSAESCRPERAEPFDRGPAVAGGQAWERPRGPEWVMRLKSAAYGVLGVGVVLGSAALPLARSDESAAQVNGPSAPVCRSGPVHAGRLQGSCRASKPRRRRTALTLTWQGERNDELRLHLAIVGGTPTIRELAVRRGGGQWSDAWRRK